MPTELNFSRFAFLLAAVGLALVIVLGAPMRIPAGWDKAAHFVAFSLLTLCLWQATAGAMPLVLLGGIIAFGALDEMRQAHLPERVSDAKDFLVDLCAALATGALLFMQRKPLCAESSPR